MNYKDWLKEYYPTKAGAIPQNEAIDHSLKKWVGLRTSVLNEYSVFKYRQRYDWHIRCGDNDIDILEVNASSCALCEYYLDDLCAECPLMQIRGSRCDDGDSSPYVIFLKTGNPEPMIALLELAKEVYE